MPDRNLILGVAALAILGFLAPDVHAQAEADDAAATSDPVANGNTSQAAAAPTGDVDGPRPAEQLPAMPIELEPPRYYSPWAALGLSVLATGAGLGMLYLFEEDDNGNMGPLGVLTLIIGPNVGHIYTGDRAGWWQLGVRGGLSLLLVYAFTFQNGAIGIPSLIGFSGSALLGFIDAPLSAGRANRRVRRRVQRLTLTPTIIRDARLRGVTGLGLTGQF